MSNTVFSGRRVSVGIAKEATRGTGVAAQYWMPHTAITFSEKITRGVSEAAYGSIGAPFTAYTTQKWCEGDIEGEINVNSFGLILLALFGTETPSANTPETGTHTHAYTLQDDNICDSLSIRTEDPIGDLLFKRGMLNSLTIDIPLGEIVTFTANFISTHHTDTSHTPSWSKDYHFISPNLTFKVAVNTDRIAAATKINLKSLSITFEKDVERIEILGSLSPEDIANKGMRINGTLELNYEDRTWRDYMVNGGVRAMQIQLESTQIIGPTTPTYPKLNMIFPKVQFHTWEPARGLGDIASQTINFDVFLDISTGTNRMWSTMDLINTTASTGY